MFSSRSLRLAFKRPRLGALQRTLTLTTLVSTISLAHAAAPSTLVKLPAQDVLAVRVAPGAPGAYAEAFGKLVGHYTQRALHIRVAFPQQSVTLQGQHYAAIGVQGEAPLATGIERLSLPACRFLQRPYTGDYEGIGPAVEAVVNEALSRQLQIDSRCGVRIRHLNSPDDTPVARLRHVIEVPVAPRPAR